MALHVVNQVCRRGQKPINRTHARGCDHPPCAAHIGRNLNRREHEPPEPEAWKPPTSATRAHHRFFLASEATRTRAPPAASSLLGTVTPNSCVLPSSHEPETMPRGGTPRDCTGPALGAGVDWPQN